MNVTLSQVCKMRCRRCTEEPVVVGWDHRKYLVGCQRSLRVAFKKEYGIYIAQLITRFDVPPTRSEFMSRRRLVEQLNTGMDRKLAFISAPAGYEKTTLARPVTDEAVL